MKLLDLRIGAKGNSYEFNGVFDLRILKTISFSKMMKLKGGLECKVRYTLDWEALGNLAIITICESKKKERKKNG